MIGEELLKFESVKNWINSLNQMALQRGKDGLTKNAKAVRLHRMWEYTKEGKLNPDELLKQAEENIDNAGEMLQDYFTQKKKTVSHNTALTAMTFVRGFYTHNDLHFTKKWSLPKREVSQVSKRDAKTSLYKYDETNDKMVLKNGKLQQFIQNLNFRDQTICLCLFSSGADATDILNLKMDFVLDEFGEISDVKRFFWYGNRSKNGQPFKTFFSEETTQFLKRYVKQERKGAGKDELLFPGVTTHGLSINYKVAARNMGYKEKNTLSPFRPKRFRHLFRTACAIAKIDEGYIKSMMGHANGDVSAGYLNQDKGIFEKMYVKVEPLLTVFGSGSDQMKQEFVRVKDTLALVVEGTKGVADKTTRLENEVKELTEKLECAVNYIWHLKGELELRDKTEAEEEFRKMVEEINKEQPVTQKSKKSPS